MAEVKKLMKRQIEPLVPLSMSQTQLSKFLSIGPSSIKEDTDSLDLSKSLPVESSVAADYLSDILDTLQTHISKCSKDVTIEQNRLFNRCKMLDDTAAAVTKKMSQSLNQAAVTAEKIGQVGSFKVQSERLRTNLETVVSNLWQLEKNIEAQKVIEINPTIASTSWPLLHKLKYSDDSDPSYVGEASTDAIQEIDNKPGDQSTLLRSITSLASISLSKASLLAPPSQSRPAIVRTTTSHSSLAAKSQLEELAAAADKQEDRLKLARHKSTN
ncbi:hypothetical protein INT43_008223 [Umbelopsis isabellina]|uniref:BLOC-1-related complex subunit 5 n=1 Tax=Mortierella isabellina TaxID=91625 RepID=A0A8H7PDF4_MORIS|nr:hypothetical protein INT43_008223 [Umbelopsis isabellina]